MKYDEMVGRVKELAGARLSDAQASTIVSAVIRMTTAEGPVEYADCTHTSKEMLAHYGKTGRCGICIDEKNRRLAASVSEGAAGGITGGLLIGALAGHAMFNRLLQVLSRHGRCENCETGLLEPRRHGCVRCREDRSWLARMTKRAKAGR